MTTKFVTLLILLPFYALAQSNYKDGYLITQSGDSLAGSIDYKEWYKTPEKIKFRNPQGSGEEREYVASDLQYLSIAGT